MVLAKLLNSSTTATATTTKKNRLKKRVRERERGKWKRWNERHRKNFTFRWYLNVAICTCEHQPAERNQGEKMNSETKKKNNWDEAQNRQFSMRLTFVVIYSFIFKPLLFFNVGVVAVAGRFDATENCCCCCLYRHCFSFLLRFVRFRLIFEFN